MLKQILVAAALLALASEAPTAVGAQGRARPQGRQGYTNRVLRSTVTPYLNLNRRGGTAVNNYYTLVRPQLQQEVINGRQQDAVRDLSDEFNQDRLRQSEEALPATGHPVRYRYFSHFYNKPQ